MRRLIGGEVKTPTRNLENKSVTEGDGYMHSNSVDLTVEIPSTHSMVVAGPLTVTSTGSLVVNGTLVIV